MLKIYTHVLAQQVCSDCCKCGGGECVLSVSVCVSSIRWEVEWEEQNKAKRRRRKKNLPKTHIEM